MNPPEKDQQELAAERSRRRRSIAIGMMLGFMVLAFYFATFVRFSGGLPTKGL